MSILHVGNNGRAMLECKAERLRSDQELIDKRASRYYLALATALPYLWRLSVVWLVDVQQGHAVPDARRHASGFPFPRISRKAFGVLCLLLGWNLFPAFLVNSGESKTRERSETFP